MSTLLHKPKSMTLLPSSSSRRHVPYEQMRRSLHRHQVLEEGSREGEEEAAFPRADGAEGHPRRCCRGARDPKPPPLPSSCDAEAAAAAAATGAGAGAATRLVVVEEVRAAAREI